jgi:hypothetical protein
MAASALIFARFGMQAWFLQAEMEVETYFLNAEEWCSTDKGSWNNNPFTFIPEYHWECKMPENKEPRSKSGVWERNRNPNELLAHTDSFKKTRQFRLLQSKKNK